MNAIDILEEAVGLLRAAPLRALVTYLLGAAPFVVGLLFLNDMTRSAFAFDHLATWSLGLAILYVWKSVWQAVFAAELYRTVSPGSRRAVKPLRLVAMQASLQPVGLLLMLPFPWLVAFFRNVGLFAALGVEDPVRVARRQAALWTRQNWGVLAIATLTGCVLFLNFLVMIFLLPQLARSFLGIEGDLARLGSSILNVSSAGAAAALAWMVVDPLLDAVFVLRCYYGESIATGEDLLAALRRATAGVALLVVGLCAAPAARAQVDPVQLDRSIDQVIHGREFSWRTPRAEVEPQGRVAGWIRAAQKSVKQLWEFLKYLFDRLFKREQGSEAGGKEAVVSRRTMEALIGVALALVAGSSIFYFIQRRTPAVAAQAVTLAAAVNLADEAVTADQLPESSWLQLAEEWLAKGDSRLALRALYLGGLNYLSGRGLVSIRRWKSGRDYRGELERRARATPEVSREFSQLTAVFEYGWYGRHGVDRATVEKFASELSAMRGHVEKAL